MNNNYIYYYDQYLNNDDLNARIYTNKTDGIKLLFKGFLLNDTLEVNIKNNWGTEDTVISQIMNKSKDVGQKILKNIRQVDQLTGGRLSSATSTNDDLNAKLISASDYYKNFNGTEINYSNLTLYYYAITDVSNHDIVKEFTNILINFVGKFEVINQTNGLSGRILPPNNFRMPATFNNKFIPGSYIIKTRASTYNNLLCSNVTYEISPQRTQNNKPLFIIAKFSFINGTIISLNDLINNHIK